jgi:hypothetical protein
MRIDELEDRRVGKNLQTVRARLARLKDLTDRLAAK